MAAAARFHLLYAPPFSKPSVLLSRFPHSLRPFSAANANLRTSHLRNFSATPPLCSSSSDAVPEALVSSESSSSIVGDLLDYLNESWTQFHATAEAKRQLIAAGFHLLNENEEWDLKPGGRYFFTRNMSSLVAFAIGKKYSIGNGFHIIAAHTDSPCMKLKPRSASCKSGYLMVNVQTYGGGLWHTWFDRDLTVAGRVILRAKDGSFLHRLVKVKRPLLRVPTLAIHLNRTVNQDGFKPNLETHLVPLLATKPENGSDESAEKTNGSSSKDVHHQLLLQILSDELGCEVGDIASIELNICDTQPSCLGGANNEFIFSGRLDNLASSFCSLRALVDSCSSPEDLVNEDAIRMIALFDNEEVGSDSYQGAGAPTMFEAMRRITYCLGHQSVGESIFARSIRHSFLVSADMAHGVHPNFTDKHEEHHRPELQKGLVIKHNANQRYATSGVTSFLFKEVARIHNLPTQDFVVRNDMGCGSTIGPILASGVGIRTVDCGIAQLSMHSVREICGKEDIDIAYKHFKAFYQTFSTVDRKLNVDC
ncbi:probable aspartyl aminopeptidase [Ipomoea triloba]|uniref:probable aspartyl aminopeptidase n=1 Tax=Ipomoea triloba TaxID=35885 RepID=UPI00125E7024|nr:probable aspartyl aminopeptidase [Ipomoea triloba]XP_031109290.1 probable aspartyl aminopeptidase [Ipomoea triloba]XP_031109291.1 probable aspartyl aminopeptidase [Ipomoea triloba]XP_031109292.1 probable aspartyl aminopeptidase [Ipomoea triloba]XP_031109294.1 probable aspartyl aminopeptidase [Ipomoea triloba]XP_031109295.1 probable aspartyl aminopeptidase [Ipomoea triloba]